MADTKITSLLTPQVTTNPATDVLPIVNIADTSMASSGSTRKVTVNQLLGAGGTATLASATITGDLTVDTSTLVVNSSQNRVGIGFSGNASSGRLQISQPLSSTIDGALRITDDATTSFVFNNVSSGVSGIWSSGAIAFGVGSGTFAEAMRLNATGLGVGASPLTKIHIEGASATTASTLQIVGAATSTLLLGQNADGGVIRGQGGNNCLTFWTGGSASTAASGTGTERMRIDTSGNVGIGVTPSAGKGCLQLSSGINFPATQVASSDANTLDDYEEGNWTPTVGDASSGGNQATTATAVGRYTKIGRLVTVQWEVTDINTTGLTAGNAVYIRGLPFASSSVTTQFGTPAVSGVTFSGYLTAGVFNGSSFPIYSSSSGGSLVDIKVSALASGTADIWGTLTYIV